MEGKKHNHKGLVIAIILIALISMGTYSFIKIKAKLDYEKTYEYKLINKGYQESDASKLAKIFKDTELEYILNNEISDVYLNIANDKYFIYDQFYDYLNYKQESDKDIREVVERVNTKTNKAYYEDSTPTDVSKKELMLVNKYTYLDETYEPEELVTIPPTYSYGEIGSQKATQSTYDAFLDMWRASHEQGYYLMVNSSYRTHEKQQAVYNDYKKSYGTTYADSIAARPGYSEHQTGYTLDIFEQGTSQKTFPQTDSYKWLVENAHKYGFIQRYPEDKEEITGYNFESWHYRYVGVEAATYIYENNITFDEYYAYFVK